MDRITDEDQANIFTNSIFYPQIEIVFIFYFFAVLSWVRECKCFVMQLQSFTLKEQKSHRLCRNVADVSVISLAVFQIAYFCTKHGICWVSKCAKSVYTEKYVKIQLYYLRTQNSPKFECGTMDTSQPQWTPCWWWRGSYVTNLRHTL